MNKYESDWQRFAFSEDGTSFADKEEIADRFSWINLRDEKYHSSGIPLFVDGDMAVVNNETEHCLVIGETDSKKTRCFVWPMLHLLAGAGESAVILDPKEELSGDAATIEALEAKGVNVVKLNLRTFDDDGYNIFEEILNLYHRGEVDKAKLQMSNLINEFCDKQRGGKIDPYWADMSECGMIGSLTLLLEISKQNPEYRRYVNMLSLVSFLSESNIKDWGYIMEDFYEDNTNEAVLMMKNIIETPDRTRSCILSTAMSILKEFVTQPGLLRMLSATTFSVEELYEKPTFVFVVIPDETSAYDRIAGVLMDNIYNQLIGIFTQKYLHRKKPKCRINWLCDEFANVKINDMRSKISISRGRYMRWFIVCQSKKQLEAEYESEAATILGNCKNLLFLNSSDPEMLKYVSNLAGNTNISKILGGEPLLPEEALKKLKKAWEYKEAIFIRDNLVFKVKLCDVDALGFTKNKTGKHIGKGRRGKKVNTVDVYTPGKFYDDLRDGEIELPFEDEV